MTADGVYKLLQVYAEKIGLTGIERLGVHALRATAATNALDSTLAIFLKPSNGENSDQTKL